MQCFCGMGDNVGSSVKWSFNKVGIGTRNVAFRIVAIFLFGTLVGSLLPETGTVLAYNLGIFSHIFNPYFFAVGIIGVSLACAIGHRRCG